MGFRPLVFFFPPLCVFSAGFYSLMCLFLNISSFLKRGIYKGKEHIFLSLPHPLSQPEALIAPHQGWERIFNFKKMKKKKCHGGHGLLLFLSCSPAVCTWVGAGLILLFCFGFRLETMKLVKDCRDILRGWEFFVVFFAIPTNVFACVMYSHFSC